MLVLGVRTDAMSSEDPPVEKQRSEEMNCAVKGSECRGRVLSNVYLLVEKTSVGERMRWGSVPIVRANFTTDC